MRVLVVAAIALGMTSCASDPKPFIGPDGRQAFTVTCDDWGEAMELCYSKARTVCGGNYDVIASVDDRKPVPSTAVTVPVRSLSVSCKAST